jgi:sterol desaturase/sphingolipid hydroxylase (fatty acid hydroxylase superfamily)
MMLGWLVGAALLGLAIAERRWPLRHRVEPQLRRVARNVTIAGVGFSAAAVADFVLGVVAIQAVRERRLALAWLVPLPPVARAVLGFLVLDYMLYVWHRLNHRVPLLWRFHVVHHIDRDLDISTGIRFHFGELAMSAGIRGVQALLLGADSFVVLAYQAALFVSVLFHHSNLRLPIQWERALNHVVVTPRMHGIHHSIVERETHSNFSSLLTCWDSLHGTLRLNVPQQQITVGVPASREDNEITLLRVLRRPFGHQPPSWRLPAGQHPDREDAPVPRWQLLT